MPTIPGGVWQIILWIVLALIAVFLFQNIVLPLIHTIQK
jgi:hypothetical protein